MVAEINVTPLVDVMLVLLIIFMVTAPMMTQGIDVNLPKTTSKALRQQDEPLVVQIDASGEVHLGKVTVSISRMRQELEKRSLAEKQEPVYFMADEQVPYGVVAQVMAAVKQAGFEKLGMVTEPEKDRN